MSVFKKFDVLKHFWLKLVQNLVSSMRPFKTEAHLHLS
jgi:hypothetical protein